MLAGHIDPITLVNRARVAITGTCRTAGRLSICRTVGAIPWTELCFIAFPCCRLALGAGGCKAISRTGRTCARARLGHIALARRHAADCTCPPGRMLAGHIGPIALVNRTGVAITGTCRATGLLVINRTAGARPVATLGHVAVSRRRTAGRTGVARRMGAYCTAAVADVFRADVAIIGTGCVRSEERRVGKDRTCRWTAQR